MTYTVHTDKLFYSCHCFSCLSLHLFLSLQLWSVSPVLIIVTFTLSFHDLISFPHFYFAAESCSILGPSAILTYNVSVFILAHGFQGQLQRFCRPLHYLCVPPPPYFNSEHIHAHQTYSEYCLLYTSLYTIMSVIVTFSFTKCSLVFTKYEYFKESITNARITQACCSSDESMYCLYHF